MTRVSPPSFGSRKRDLRCLRAARDCLGVGQIQPFHAGGETHRTVQRAGIEQMPAERIGNVMRLIVPLPEPEGPSIVRTGRLLFGHGRHVDIRSCNL